MGMYRERIEALLVTTRRASGRDALEVAYATTPVRLGAATGREVWKRRHGLTLRFCSSWPTLTDAGAKCTKGDKGPEA
jgi:hypothetical protein